MIIYRELRGPVSQMLMFVTDIQYFSVALSDSV